jgi:hypothetical protein
LGKWFDLEQVALFQNIAAMLLQVSTSQFHFLPCEKNWQKLVSTFTDLGADGFQFEFVTKVLEGVLPRPCMLID